jgi:hypothetical protein
MGINIAWNYNNPQEYLEMIRKGNMPPLIISVALTGGLQGKEVNPASKRASLTDSKASSSILTSYLLPKMLFPTPTIATSRMLTS